MRQIIICLYDNDENFDFRDFVTILTSILFCNLFFMELFFSQFLDLFTANGALALLNIILIDIVMSGDNAILIGMATRKLQ